MPLQWRHNEHPGISNHRRLDCLFHRLFRLTSKPVLLALCVGNPLVDSPHKVPVTRKRDYIWWRQHVLRKGLVMEKAFPCHDAIVAYHDLCTLRWRHNDSDGVSNHQPHDCLLNRLFGRISKKTSKLRVTGLCVGNSPGPVNSPHKGPVTRKMFPFDDVIMKLINQNQWSYHGSYTMTTH